jgi:hypothetical protein
MSAATPDKAPESASDDVPPLTTDGAPESASGDVPPLTTDRAPESASCDVSPPTTDGAPESPSGDVVPPTTDEAPEPVSIGDDAALYSGKTAYKSDGKLVKAEAINEASVSLATFAGFAEAGGGVTLALFVVLFFAVAMGGKLFSDFWLVASSHTAAMGLFAFLFSSLAMQRAVLSRTIPPWFVNKVNRMPGKK